MDDFIQIRFLRVVFSERLEPWEVPAFRGAIIAKTGQDNLLFHNHVNDNEFRYGYPLIQYKRIQGKAALVCLGAGVDEIHKFFSQPNWALRLSGRVLDVKIEDLRLQQYNLQVWDKVFYYRIQHWVALDQDSYRDYKALDSEMERLGLLESKLRGNVLSMAKGLGWHVAKPISCHLLGSPIVGNATVKGVKMMTFSGTFKTNVFLPPYIGLGKSASLGFGVISVYNKEKQHTTT